jgi:hypothetical protein
VTDKSDTGRERRRRRLPASFKEWSEADMPKSPEELAKALFEAADQKLKKKEKSV